MNRDAALFLACLLLPLTLGATEPGPSPKVPLRAELLTTVPDHDFPWIVAITQSPDPHDERLLIGTFWGVVYELHPDGKLSTFLDVSAITPTAAEHGFFDMEFHPGFGDTNWVFYINHVNPQFQSILARYEMSEEDRSVVDVSSRTEIFSGPATGNHNAGQIKFGPDGYLYLATGDYRRPCKAQQLIHPHGKILRIDVDLDVDGPPHFAIPPDNPFVDDPDALDEIFHLGLRNPWRFSFDRATGDMWIGDVGQTAREEINHVHYPFESGLNFGWPFREGDIAYAHDCEEELPEPDPNGFTEPNHVYVHDDDRNRSVTGGYVYRGSRIPGLQGRYVFGDFISNRVWTMDPSDYSVIEAFRLDLPFGLTTFGEDRDGELYFAHSTKVYRIVPAGGDWMALE